MESFVVIGLGRFGMATANRLAEFGCEVMAIDVEESKVQQIADNVTRAVTADAQNKDVLKALGVQDCECAVVAIGEDLAAAVLITLNLRELGVKYIVCKARNEQYKTVLEKVGADRILIPEQMIAEKLARNLHSPDIIDYIELSEDFGIIDTGAPNGWIGKSLRQLDIRAALEVSIIAIRRNGDIVVAPQADDVILRGDVLVLLGRSEALESVKAL